jgi:hypothetical protein
MYRFLCDEGVGHEQVRRVEFLDAVLRALVVQPATSFALPEEVAPAGFGYFALAPLRRRNLLFAVVAGNLVRGPISESCAAFLCHLGVRPQGSPLSAEEWQCAGGELASVGIEF